MNTATTTDERWFIWKGKILVEDVCFSPQEKKGIFSAKLQLKVRKLILGMKHSVEDICLDDPPFLNLTVMDRMYQFSTLQKSKN